MSTIDKAALIEQAASATYGELDALESEASTGRRNGDPYEVEYAQGLADADARIRATLPTEASIVSNYFASHGITQAVRDVAYERMTHGHRGWTAEHDAEHGVAHLVGLAVAKVQPLPLLVRSDRDSLVKAASLLVAAVELLDAIEAEVKP